MTNLFKVSITMKKLFLAAAMAVVALTGCNNDNEQVLPEGKPEYITVSSHIGTFTRVATNGNSSSFEEGDRISVYSWTGSANVVDAAHLVVNNAVNTLQGGVWSATTMMRWTDMTTPHFFLSVYPSRAITDFMADAVTVDPLEQEESDLLVATNPGNENQGLIATNNPVPLRFDHMMSKLVVQLEFRNEFNGMPAVTAVTTEASSTGTIDYLTGVTTPVGTAATFALPVVAAGQEYASIMLPQSIQTVTVVIDGKNYVYTHPTPFSLVKGKIQTVRLIVGRNRIELDQVTISDWETGEVITGGEAFD